MSGATSRARYNKPITLTSKLPFSIFGSISRKLPQASSDRVVDENLGRAKTALYISDHGPHLALLRDVAGHRVHVREALAQGD